MHEGQVLSESFMRVEIELQIQSRIWIRAGDDVREVSLQFRSREHGNGITADLFKSVAFSGAQIPARQLVIPGPVAELRDRPGINVLDFARHTILLNELAEPVVESRVVGIAVDLGAVDAERIQWTLQLRQTRKVLVQHSDVLL